MIYRIRVDLAFEEEDPALDVYDKALDHIDKAVIINPGQLNEERGYIEVQRCYHNQTPNIPCERLAREDVPYP